MICLKVCTALALLTIATAVPAQTVYKCKTATGTTYSDTPCSGQNVTIVHRATPLEKINALLEGGRHKDAEAYAQSHDVEDLYKKRLRFYQQRRLEQQRRYEVAARQSRARQAQQAEIQAQQQRQQQAYELSNLRQQNQNLRQRNAQYDAALQAQQRASRQALQDQRDRSRRASAAAQAAAQAEAMTPKFNPQTGQWCQVNGGTMNCW